MLFLCEHALIDAFVDSYSKTHMIGISANLANTISYYITGGKYEFDSEEDKSNIILGAVLYYLRMKELYDD